MHAFTHGDVKIASMNAREECTSYVDKIFLSIKKNIQTLEDEDALQSFLKSISSFYASLFSGKAGTVRFFSSVVCPI